MKSGYMPVVYGTQADVDAGTFDAMPGITVLLVDGSGIPTGVQLLGTTGSPTISGVATQFRGTVGTSTFPTTGGTGTAGALVPGDLWYITTNVVFTATSSNNINGATSGTLAALGGDELIVISNSGGVVNWDIIQKELGYTPENSVNKGVASGYASLDGSTKVPSAQLPQATDVVVGASAFEGTTNPTMAGTASVGTATTMSHSDHTHPTDTSRAPLASPTFTGIPAVPTAAVDTNTTQAASTAYVVGQATSTTPTMAGVAAVGTETKFARGDHVHPTDTSRAPTASPALTGVPTTPTAAVDTNTTQIASTAFVVGQAGSSNPVMAGIAAPGSSLRYSRQDHVHPVDTSRAAAGANSDITSLSGLTSVIPVNAQWNATQTVTSNTTLTNSPRIVLGNATGGAFNVTLPAPSTTMHIIVKKLNGTASPDITVLPASGTIDGAASVVLHTQYSVTRITSDGTNYFTI